MIKMIFFNGGWMSSYDGAGADSISDGGAYVKEKGFGGEVYNFRNSGGKNYGYVMTKAHSLNLSRISGEPAKGDGLEDVFCVFTAKHPKFGVRRIVGWYRNATVYSEYKKYAGSDRAVPTNCLEFFEPDKQIGYYAVAKNSDAVLLPEDERLNFPLMPHGKGGFGEHNVWYADSDLGWAFRKVALDFILKYQAKKMGR
jgi:hypothetical protein